MLCAVQTQSNKCLPLHSFRRGSVNGKKSRERQDIKIKGRGGEGHRGEGKKRVGMKQTLFKERSGKNYLEKRDLTDKGGGISSLPLLEICI